MKSNSFVSDINQIYEVYRDNIDHERELLMDAVQGTSPCCGSSVALGHCEGCGEPCDPIEELNAQEEADLN